MVEITKKYSAVFCFSKNIFIGVSQSGKFEFSETGITAYWLGSILYHLEYTDLLRVERTGMIFHWLKFVGVKDCIYVKPMSYEALYIEIMEREIPFVYMKKSKNK